MSICLVFSAADVMAYAIYQSMTLTLPTYAYIRILLLSCRLMLTVMFASMHGYTLHLIIFLAVLAHVAVYGVPGKPGIPDIALYGISGIHGSRYNHLRLSLPVVGIAGTLYHPSHAA